jgi:inosine/xanthosine triphosphatase
VKIGAVADAVAALSVAADVIGIAAASGVPSQPWGDEETLAGARHRLADAKREAADVWVGIEGGLIHAVGRLGQVDAMAWLVAEHADGRIGTARTATFELPPALAERVLAGDELGPADDALHGTHGNKTRGGTVGRLTRGVITRRAYYAHAAVLALVRVVGGNG